MDGERLCALPGCDEVVTSLPGRPERRFCSPVHRESARQARRDANRLARAAVGAAGGEAAPAGVAVVAVAPAGVVEEPAAAAQPVVVSHIGSRPARPRPPADVPPRRDRRHRRAIAVLGAAGALVAGYCITASGPDVAATHPSVLAVPQLADERGWAAQAEVVLASVGGQLDDVARAEAQWQALPEQVRERRAATYVALLRRKAYLETQKTLLQTQLGTYRSLTRAGDELRQTQQQLAYIERELTIATDPARRTPAQSALVAALEENHRTLERRRDAKQDEMRGLSADVATAARVPLLDDPEATRRATADVRRIVADPTAPAPHDVSDDHRPEAVPGRPAQRDGMPSVEVGTGAPPDPGSSPVDRLAAGGDGPVVPVAHVESVPGQGSGQGAGPGSGQGAGPGSGQGAGRVPDQGPDRAPDEPQRRSAPVDAPPREAPAETVAPVAAQAPPPSEPVQAPAPTPVTSTAPAPQGPAARAVDMVAPGVDWMYPGMADTVRAAEAEQVRRAAAQQDPPPPADTAATATDDPDRVVG
ncbi:hypothetical protein PSU4_44640 [Pseudonocardia sulfidoxydans NBRC 16205]|uniref:Uncharacterized protein n=2 Tax=Pseudonocardia sulfidoxydans TaxID=54011 RepID=A0A511DL19_9PSEU|nr:hypothetical protein [Pseudonocardia sulfidoxydans]GEL25510.1 hypothetical protein PSU4_44640 [Pseudonocardia sulfidoxydans NBRC 16205]